MSIPLYPNNLKLLRDWRRISQIELADAARCSQSTVSKYEQGLRPIPRELQQVFADVLKVPIRMICEPVTVILQAWERLVSDPRLPILVEEMLTYDSKKLSRLVHSVSESHAHNYAL